MFLLYFLVRSVNTVVLQFAINFSEPYREEARCRFFWFILISRIFLEVHKPLHHSFPFFKHPFPHTQLLDYLHLSQSHSLNNFQIQTLKTTTMSSCPALLRIIGLPTASLMAIAYNLLDPSEMRQYQGGGHQRLSAASKRALATTVYFRQGRNFAINENYNDMTRLQLEHELRWRGCLPKNEDLPTFKLRLRMIGVIREEMREVREAQQRAFEENLREEAEQQDDAASLASGDDDDDDDEDDEEEGEEEDGNEDDNDDDEGESDSTISAADQSRKVIYTKSNGVTMVY